MSELLKIYFLSSNVRTCFFYRNNIDFYKDHSDDVWGIKIKFGKKFEFTTFGSISLLSVPEVPDKCIGVSSLLASKLGLQENDQVLISNFFSPSIQALEMSPKREEDYVILVSTEFFALITCICF